MFNTSLTLKKIKSTFKAGNKIYYSCIYPEFEWFDKKFSIKKIITPTRFTIIQNTIMNDYINNEDRFLLSRLAFSGAIRKYKMTILLSNEDEFNIDIFENTHKQSIMLYEQHIIIGHNKKNVLEDFYKLTIYLKADIDFDKSHTTIINDSNFILFRKLYLLASDMYPEEVIKSYDKKL